MKIGAWGEGVPPDVCPCLFAVLVTEERGLRRLGATGVYRSVGCDVQSWAPASGEGLAAALSPSRRWKGMRCARGQGQAFICWDLTPPTAAVILSREASHGVPAI